MRIFSRRRQYGGTTSKLERYSPLILVGIIVIAAALRLWGIEYGLPYMYRADEPMYVKISQDIVKNSDLNPHFFNYPSLFFYLNALVYLPFFLVSKLTGSIGTISDIATPVVLVLGVGKTDMPVTVLIGRCLTVAISVGTVGLTYLVGRRLTNNKSVGLIAALLTALSPTNVMNSRSVTPDSFVTFFVLLAFWGAVHVYQRGKTSHYILTGIAVGLAAGSKYNGAIIIFALIAAHFLAEGWATGLKERRFYLALLLAAVAFVVSTPYAVLDFPTFISNVQAEAIHYTTGHQGMDGNSLLYYVDYLWAIEGIIALLAMLEVARAIYMRLSPIVLLSVFPVAYFAFINCFVVRNDRTLLPMTPFLFLLGASFVTRLVDARPYAQPAMRNTPIFAGAALSVIAILFGAIQSVTLTAGSLNGLASREQARAWIEKNLPKTSVVAIESYTSYVDPANYTVGGYTRMIDHGTQWYVDQGFQYAVFSQGMFGRYYKEKVKYAGEVSRYDDLFRTYRMVKVFPDESNEIRIYRVQARNGIRQQVLLDSPSLPETAETSAATSAPGP